MSVNTWSKTPADNATADTGINWRNNQAPSNVKANGRTTMAEIAEWRDDLAGMLDTTGTATAFAITTNQDLASLSGADGFRVAARMHLRSGLAPTLNVDGTGARNITRDPSVTLDYGQLTKGSVHEFVYDEGDDEWRLVSPLPGWYVGEIRDTARSAAPDGWLLCSGLTIGNASSGGTARANADTELLFTVLWGDYSNDILPIQTSTGSASTRGASAAADFAANKRLPLPDLRGRVLAGKDNMGGTSANRLTDQTGGLNGDNLGASGGSETHTLTEAQLAGHTHTFNAGSHTHSFSATTGSDGDHTHTFSGTTSSNAHTHTFSGTTASGGSHSHTFSGTTSSSGTHGHPTRCSDASNAGSNGSGGFMLDSDRDGNYDAHDSSPSATIGNQIGAAGEHTHTYSGTTSSHSGHTHTYSGTTSSYSHTHTYSGTTSSNGSHTHTVSGTTGGTTVSGTTASTGDGSAHNNVQPTWIVNKMIKL